MKKHLHLIIVLISVAAVFSGISQMVMPGFVLGIIGANVTPTSSHFFAIIGMFMALFGGLMLHAIYSARPQRPAILWCAFQKLGAFAAVTIGVFGEIFSAMAMTVAIFDLVSGLIFLYYLKTIKDAEV